MRVPPIRTRPLQTSGERVNSLSIAVLMPKSILAYRCAALSAQESLIDRNSHPE